MGRVPGQRPGGAAVALHRRYGGDSRRWFLDEYGPGERLQLDSIAVELAVDEVCVDRVGTIVA